MADLNQTCDPSPLEMAKGILEGWCVRHDVALERAENDWVTCPRSVGAARAQTIGSEIVVEINQVSGHEVVRIPLDTAHNEV